MIVLSLIDEKHPKILENASKLVQIHHKKKWDGHTNKKQFSRVVVTLLYQLNGVGLKAIV